MLIDLSVVEAIMATDPARHLESIPCPELSRFERIAAEVGALVTEKNLAYGDSFVQSGKVMALLYPDGIAVEQMRDALGVVRVVDKLFRIATRKKAFGESPWRDVAGYGIVATAADEVDEA